jgi:hypothetical protein
MNRANLRPSVGGAMAAIIGAGAVPGRCHAGVLSSDTFTNP